MESVPGADRDTVDLVALVGDPATYAFRGRPKGARIAGLSSVAMRTVGNGLWSRVRLLLVHPLHPDEARRPPAGAPCKDQWCVALVPIGMRRPRRDSCDLGT